MKNNIFNDWSQENIETFKMLAEKGFSTQDLCSMMNREEEDILCMAEALDICLRSFTDVGHWSDEELDVLKEVYPTNSKDRIMNLFPGLTWEDIQVVAKKMGYNRGDSPKYLSARETKQINKKTTFLENKIKNLQNIMYLENNANVDIAIPDLKVPEDAAGTYYAVFSDWHTFKRIIPEVVRGYNKYDEEVFSERLTNGIYDNIQKIKAGNYKAIRVVFLGDMMEGNIHETTNIYSASRTQLLLKKYLVYTLERLAEVAPIEKVIAMVGNHSRLTTKPTHKNKVEETHECTVYEFVRESTRHIVKDFVIPKAQYYTDVPYLEDGSLSGVGYIFTHGDGFKGSSNNLAGIPGTNSKTILREAANQQYNAYLQQIGKLKVDYEVLPFLTLGACICGHFHSAWDVPLLGTPGRFIGVGSLCGVDEYASNVLAVGDQPTQFSFSVDSYGLLKERFVIEVI